jgi:carbamoyltransferase
LLTFLPEHGHPPILINTSFNIGGEPMVETAADAIKAFRSSPIDLLAVGCEASEK